MSKNIIWHKGDVSRDDRSRRNNHKSGLVWFTGLSASGKSTLAHAVDKALFERGIHSYVLDGDNVRHGINSNLGFSKEDRSENLRRIMEVSKLFVDAGIVVLAAFISPHREDRAFIRKSLRNDNFLEIYVKCSLTECERRDPKGQYKKARAGTILNYTGISAPYEEPEAPDFVIDTEQCDIEASTLNIIQLMNEKFGLE